MSQAATYRAQAAQMLADAAATPLANVRERCERSAAAWTDMAERAERTEVSRDKRAAETLTRAATAAE